MFLPLVTLICCVNFGKSLDWKTGNVDFSETYETDNDKCLVSQDQFCRNNLEAEYFLRKKASPSSFTSVPGHSNIIKFFQSLRHCPCACKMDYPIMDLGKKYFPRYIQTGMCKTDSCGSHHRCVEKKYKVTVIKQKDVADKNLPETKGLPLSLQDAWISETISISIACECIPII